MSPIETLPLETEDPKLPPFWGGSFWWTRTGALIGLASLILGVVMAFLLARHLGPCGLANQLTNPTLAIEVAGSWYDVLSMAGPCEASRCLQSTGAVAHFAGSHDSRVVCPDKVSALASEQYLDFAFIVIYWLFFLYLGLINWKFCYSRRFPLFSQVLGRVAGIVTMAAGSIGAFSDWRENQNILQTLTELRMMDGPVPLMRYFAFVKWRLVFLAIGTASPIFIFWPGKNDNGDERPSAFSQLVAWTTAVLALSTSWTGVAACLYGDDHRLEVATERLNLVILATLLTFSTAQTWRGGTLKALNRLAKLPLLRFFATLFASESEP